MTNMAQPHGSNYNSQGVAHPVGVIKDYMSQPPTFHPFHYQFGSQNSIQTPPHNSYVFGQNMNNSKIIDNPNRESDATFNAQATPKYMGGNLTGYDSQMHASLQYPDSREGSRERMLSSQKDTLQGNQKGVNSSQNVHILTHDQSEQDSKITQNSDDLKSFTTKLKQIDAKDIDNQLKKQLFDKLILQYQTKFTNSGAQKYPDDDSKHMKIINQNTDLETAIRSDNHNEELDVENYIKNNLEKNIKLAEDIRKSKKPKNEKELQQHLIQRILNQNEEKGIQTPRKNLDQMMQSTDSYQYSHPPQPQHITSSMRKIRTSPAPAENEQLDQEDNSESPNSIVPNNYDEDDEKNKTVWRVQKSSIDIDRIKQSEIDSNPIGTGKLKGSIRSVSLLNFLAF